MKEKLQLLLAETVALVWLLLSVSLLRVHMFSSLVDDKTNLMQLYQRLKKNVSGIQGDVTNLADLDRLCNTVKDQKGHLDILFANAGIGEFAPLGEISEAHFDKIFGINVKGVLFSVQKALPLFQDGGSIILNASIAVSKGMEALSVYSATKAAVRSFARTWTVDLKHRKIRVNAVSPGPIDTPAVKGLAQSEEEVKQLKKKSHSLSANG